jgi:uncharacterized protein (DUF2141 family)
MKKNVSKKIIIFLSIFLFSEGNIFANNFPITIEIHGVALYGGKIAVAIFSNENDFKKKIPFESFWTESTNITIMYDVDLPEGDYVITVYQDINNNGRLDSFLFRPREPVGMTNYDGKGIPGGFHKLKVQVNNATKKIVISLVNI